MNAVSKFFKKHKRAVRGFIGWLGGALLQVSIVGADVMVTWSAKRWALGLAVAALPGFMGLIGVGEANPTDEELADKVEAVKAKRTAKAVAPPPAAP